MTNPSGTVLMVANYAPDIGYAWWLMEAFWIRLANAARSRGLGPLLAFPEAGEVPATIIAAHIPYVFQTFPGKSLASLIASARLIRAHRIRLVYFTDRSFTSWQYGVLRLAGVRTIITHDHSPGDKPPVGGITGTLKAMLNRLTPISSDLHVCVSPLIAARALRHLRAPGKKVAVVQNGIRPIASDAGDAGYVHREFGFPSDAKVCISVGRAHPYKRVDFFIEVARCIVHERGRADFRFVHCGDGPDIERLRRLAEEAGLGARLILAGHRDDVHQLLASSHFAVHSARGEAFSLAILEYMRAGLVTCVPDIPSVKQAVRHGSTGIVFPDGDAGAVADALLALADDPTGTARISQAATASVVRDFSEEQMFAQFDHVMGPLLDRAAR